MINKTIIILCLLIPKLVLSQTWDADKCIAYAWEHNLSLKRANIDLESSELTYKESKGAFLPELGFSAGFNENFGRSIDQTSNDYVDIKFYNGNYHLGMSVELFNGFQRINRIAFEKYNHLYNEDIFQISKNELGFKVLSIYYDVLFYKGLQRILSERLELSKKELTRTKALIETGRLSKSELYETDARVAEDSFRIMQNHHFYEKAKMQLKDLMNFPVNKQLSLVDDVFLSTITVGDSISNQKTTEYVLKNNYEAKSLEKKMLAVQREIGYQKGNVLPSLSLRAGWSSGFSEINTDNSGEIIPLGTQLKNNSSQYVGVSLYIPIFSKFRNSKSIKRAKLKYEQAKIQLEEKLNQLEKEIQLAIIELDASKNEYDAASKNQKKFEMAFNEAQKKREKGMINSIELHFAKNELIKAQSDVLKAFLQLKLKQRTINYLITGVLKVDNEL